MSPVLPSLRRSLVLSFAQKYTSLLITLPTIMVLSRLLTPKQIGVYSVAVAFVNIVQMLRDFGTSEYLIQAPTLDDATARSAFTITLIIAWSLGLALFFSSPVIAGFFAEPGLQFVLEVLSINFFLLPFGSTVNALLMRSMQYGIRYRINLGQQSIQSALTIYLAWLGFGYMSPAWGSVAGMVATIAGCMVWGRRYHIRGFGLARWRSVAGFGVQNTFGSIMSRLGDSAPDFVIGRLLGFVEVGLYSRGYGLVRMFRENAIHAIGSVAFSAFSQRHRDDERPHELYLKSMGFITCISWPFFAFASLMAFPIIRIMFGDQWDAAVPLLSLLAIQALIDTTVSHNAELLTAVGRVGVATTRITILQTVRVLVIVAAAFHGLVAVAAALIPVALFNFFYTGFTLVKYTDLEWAAIRQALLPSAYVTVFAMALPLLVRYFNAPDPENLWSPLIYSSFGAVVGWMMGIWVVKHPVWFEVAGLSRRFKAWRSR